MNTPLKLGFYELDITPPLGSIIPGDFRARYAATIQDPLYVRAVAVRSEAMSLAIVSVDTVGITLDITRRIRERVCQYIPMTPENIMVMATHAHGGGPTLNWGEEVVRNEAYLDILVAKAADSIVTAWNRAEASELFVGKETVTDISFIRVYHMKDGTLKTNPGANNPKIDRPTTTIDPEILVLAARRGDAYIGAIVNFANHPAIVADTRISGDYVSALSTRLKEIYGPQFVTVFINGACGNINHIDPFDSETRLPGREKVVGVKLAEKVASAIASAAPMTDNTLACAGNTVTVKLRKPTVEYLQEAKKIFENLGDGLVDSVPGTPDYITTFFALQAFQIMADKRTRRELTLQLFRIGSCYISGTPCQIFVQFGKRMKDACKGLAFISAFANDYCGYVPTAECMVPGVYEARLAPTSALEPAAGDILTEAMIRLYNGIPSGNP